MNRIDPRGQERALALGGLGILILFAWLFLGAPLVSLFASQMERYREVEARLVAFETRQGQIPGLEARLAELKTRPETASGLLTDETATLAAASIQTRMRPLLERHGAEIRSVQILPPVTDADFEKITVQYAFALPERALRDLLHAVETMTPYLFLDEVSIRRPENALEQEGIAPPPLEIKWNLYGYKWGIEK